MDAITLRQRCRSVANGDEPSHSVVSDGNGPTRAPLTPPAPLPAAPPRKAISYQ